MKPYLITFESQDLALSQAGFDVCLALVSLDLPLDILITQKALDFWCNQQASFEKQLKSLAEFDEVKIFIANLPSSKFKQLNYQLSF